MNIFRIFFFNIQLGFHEKYITEKNIVIKKRKEKKEENIFLKETEENISYHIIII